MIEIITELSMRIWSTDYLERRTSSSSRDISSLETLSYRMLLMPNKALEPTRVDALCSAVAVLLLSSRVAQLGR